MKNLSYRKTKHCLADREIEIFLLEKDLPFKKNEFWITDHIGKCCACFDRYSELWTYHQILRAELNKPVSRKVQHLVKGLQKLHFD